MAQITEIRTLPGKKKILLTYPLGKQNKTGTAMTIHFLTIGNREECPPRSPSSTDYPNSVTISSQSGGRSNNRTMIRFLGEGRHLLRKFIHPSPDHHNQPANPLVLPPILYSHIRPGPAV
ncbi:hypothetical protein CDAR_61031 [Caerostris darwini]|uniref:Uncharacterized protein n=1 Tax=Caerostris darwini TaxID=1538125 RepID=A0AAV4RVI2_9ARAC|nr:hypothetical protein CDAR_61031 [Caerostris darwini]